MPKDHEWTEEYDGDNKLINGNEGEHDVERKENGECTQLTLNDISGSKAHQNHSVCALYTLLAAKWLAFNN
jgi:hypothetical protein